MASQCHVIYHANCADGFGAAWAAHRFLGDENASYHPVNYGDPVPDTTPGASVYILDFSYPLETMQELHWRHAGRVTLLDHHKTALENLGGRLDNCTIDMGHSGARLAWDHFAGRTMPRPRLIDYVEDQDLWHWALPGSREVSAALESMPKDFETWDSIDVANLEQEGGAILRALRQQVERMTQNAFMSEINGHRVPTVNSQTHISETGEALLQQHPEAPFAVIYFDTTAKDGALRRHYSLRSRPSFDVSAVARYYGGGGHAQAAGFEIGVHPSTNKF